MREVKYVYCIVMELFRIWVLYEEIRMEKFRKDGVA